ncbi:MAG: DUF2523 domain-containing protein [Azoarcus sp.]|jgi:hypothetical protein|nr:DUF2523 domain-containing protein [Azoarcus sp.]
MVGGPILIPFLASAFSWLLREAILKFIVFTSVFALVSLFAPRAASLLGNFIAPGFLSNAFSGIDSGVWFVLRFFRLDFGVPLIISAYVSRFLIRRLPVIG